MNNCTRSSEWSSVRRIYSATFNSARGIAHAAKWEPAVGLELALLALAVPIGLVLAPSAAWYVAMVGALIAVLAIELLNTAIERFADHIAPERNASVGLVKDLASGAVFCGLLLAGLVWFAALAVRIGML